MIHISRLLIGLLVMSIIPAHMALAVHVNDVIKESGKVFASVLAFGILLGSYGCGVIVLECMK